MTSWLLRQEEHGKFLARKQTKRYHDSLWKQHKRCSFPLRCQHVHTEGVSLCNVGAIESEGPEGSCGPAFAQTRKHNKAHNRGNLAESPCPWLSFFPWLMAVKVLKSKNCGIISSESRDDKSPSDLLPQVWYALVLLTAAGKELWAAGSAGGLARWSSDQQPA